MERDTQTDDFGESQLAEPLSEREVAILRFMADGLSNGEIAQQLSIAMETVKWYNKGIYRKLDVRNRIEAANRAKLLGLLNDIVIRDDTQPTDARPRHNLPAQVTSFVGRQREISKIRRLLMEVRLLSLTGLAGSGKTRLALQVADTMQSQFEDGICFVPLATVGKGERPLWAIAETLGLQFYPQGRPLNQLLDHLREKSLLLVLDNFEHLLDSAEMLSEILQAAPLVKILVTSRERLNLYGEANYVVNGLQLPEMETTADTPQTESIDLFLQRARLVNPTLNPTPHDLLQIARICRLVDGMPLGIELAATWVDVLSPGEIGDEIEHSLDILDTSVRGASPTENSMRAAFARSWNLLDDSQQVAFRRLSVFHGEFDRATAESVTGVKLRTLHALVSKSLLRYAPDTGRYAIHELLRQFAQEKLENSGEAANINEAYGVYYADFMAARWPMMKDHRQQIALREVEAEIENVRAAWRYWVEQRNVARLRQFLHSFWVIYDIRGWYPAGIELFEQGVTLMREIGTEEAQAVMGWLLAAQGLLYVVSGIYDIARGPRDGRTGFAFAQQGTRLLEGIEGYEELKIIPLISLFITASQINAVDIAADAVQNCLEIATLIGDIWATAKAQQFLAIKAIARADYEGAERLALEALTTYRENGDRWSESTLCIEVLSLLTITQHQFDKAEDWIEQGLKAAEEIDFQYSQQMAYWQLGYLAALQENYSEAAIYWNKALEIGEDVMGPAIIVGFGGTGVEWGGRKLIKDYDRS